MTRRQQLNRQAQRPKLLTISIRTHRERKEQYIRNLEDEVHKLRATLLENSKEKELIMNVNKMLRNVLADSGIPLPPQVANSLAHVDSMMMADARNISDQTNMQTFTPTGQTPIVSPSQQDVTSYPGGIPGAPSIPRPMLEQEQAGIEFVLTIHLFTITITLPFCITSDHVAGRFYPSPLDSYMGSGAFVFLSWSQKLKNMMDVRTAESPEPMPCGHGLMLSCPPYPYSKMPEGTPWSSKYVPNPQPRSDAEGQMNQMTWDSSQSGLARLLALSSQFDLDGEITPVQAWSLITCDERFGQLTREDLVQLAADLGDKVHCFGFGAVVEDFEVRDALENILARPQMARATA
ncbi:AP-1-like transcription factor [Ceratocystis lukuohia]|uniref:AP-1-like transcription factor n=1 Tax=Ceratocystis lukuohia TaxID=2019550 RepID=A0ABR4MKL8_9PEZI